MKRFFALICLISIAQPSLAQTALEKAEKRLAELLAPGQTTSVALSQPIQWKAARAVEEFETPLRPLTAAPVRLPLYPIREVKPRSAPEGRPLVSFEDRSSVPTQVQLPTKPLIRLPSLDSQTPLAIPILAQPMKDRASLGEPAFEASLSAAMKKFTPTRDRPVPFVPYNLPDPFEHLRYGQLRNPPEESATPPVVPIQRPTK